MHGGADVIDKAADSLLMNTGSMMADGEHGRTQENDSLMSALGTTTGMVAALLGYRSRVLHLYGKTTISHGALSGIWYRISFCSLLPCQLKSTGQGFMLQQEWLAIPHNTNTNTFHSLQERCTECVAANFLVCFCFFLFRGGVVCRLYLGDGLVSKCNSSHTLVKG